MNKAFISYINGFQRRKTGSFKDNTISERGVTHKYGFESWTVLNSTLATMVSAIEKRE